MSWTNQVGLWLAHSAVSGALILLLGAVAVRCCREPIYRIRLIQWTFLACLLVPLWQQLGFQPMVSLDLWTTAGLGEPDPAARAGASNNEPPLDRQVVAPTDPVQPDPAVAYSALAANRPSSHEVRRGSSSTSDDSRVHARAGSQIAARSVATMLNRFTLTVYVVLVALVGGWWCVGFLRRRAIQRDAQPASDRIRGLLHSIAGDEARRVRLLESPRISSPMMWGCIRPTIVVPASHAIAHSSAQLRWELAHEWSHVVRGDFRVHLLAGLAKLVCFYQPCYWWLRRELSLSQDFLADAFAAEQGTAPESYASFLVSLARQRQAGLAGVGLGMSDRRSTLFKRIRVLLQSTRPFRQTARRMPAAMITVVAIAIMVGLGSVRLAATPADTESPQANLEQPAAENEKNSENTNQTAQQSPTESITYEGRVIDRVLGEPIAGATVEIKHELSRDPKTGQWILLETTKHVADENGQYRFTLPPEQVAEDSLYLEVNAHHPRYQSKGWSGYSHSMIRTNLKQGDPPFYATIQLWPGEPITGVVKRPDGKPAGGVQIGTYSIGPPQDGERSFGRGSFQNTQTDDDGRFQIVVATPGDGVLWIFPPDLAPQAHRIGDRRGELGTFTLKEGLTISGQVLDAKGKPVPDVAVNARRRGDGEEADEFLGSNAVANGIRAGAKTDENGRFQMKPVPAGTYRVQIEESVGDPTVERGNWFARPKTELKDVFAPLEITLAENELPEQVTIQALPHVVIRGRFFNSKGQPRASHSQHFFGRYNGDFIFQESSQPGNDGWFEFRVPHGTTEARVNTMTNEHSALRWRLQGMEEFTYGREIPLGTLEADVTGLEIIRYSAPILLVKAVDEAGDSVKGFRVSSTYAKPPLAINGAPGEQRIYQEGDVHFEEQADGRWRSSQLLPDAEISINVTMDGFDVQPQSVTVTEGETRELTFVLKKP